VSALESVEEGTGDELGVGSTEPDADLQPEL
jgi:hypothetical protein